MIEVKVKNIGLDSVTGSPVLLLADKNNENDIYPIWIGVAEAEGILLQQTGIKTPRPLTYELMKNIIQTLGGKVKEVQIVDKKNNTYIAQILIERNGLEIVIDARPSDAVNIAIRTDAPIMLDENIVSKVNIQEIKEKIKENIDNTEDKDDITTVEELDKFASEEPVLEDEEVKRFKELLDHIKPEDFAIKPEENKEEK
ncbi:MAG: bifunctional nuclease family protein [Aquificae bacterium]|nr:bifunctional nuclease family protein [Aquificota bacterium]